MVRSSRAVLRADVWAKQEYECRSMSTHMPAQRRSRSAKECWESCLMHRHIMRHHLLYVESLAAIPKSYMFPALTVHIPIVLISNITMYQFKVYTRRRYSSGLQ